MDDPRPPSSESFTDNKKKTQPNWGANDKTHFFFLKFRVKSSANVI